MSEPQPTARMMPGREVVLDATEMACRIAEAVMNAKRPDGATAAQAMGGLEAEDRAMLFTAATAALEYVRDAMQAGGVIARDSRQGMLQ